MKKEFPEDRGIRIAAELRAATSEAAGVLKDLRAAISEVRELLPAAAAGAVAAQLLPVLETWDTTLTQAIHASEVEIANRFNETGAALEALMDDFAARGNIYKVGMPVVEGVEAVKGIINKAKRATRQ